MGNSQNNIDIRDLTIGDPRIRADHQRDWIKQLLERLQITPTELARRAGVNGSTLTRFINKGNDQGHALTATTIGKIESSLGRKNYEATSPPVTGFAQKPAAPYDLDMAGGAIGSAVRALIGNRNAADPWEILNNDLEAIGLKQGDILIVDLNEQPSPGDIVCAQLFAPDSTNTVFRLWEPPYLLSGSTNPNQRRPVVVDNTNAIIKGTVIARLSPRFSLKNAA